MKDLEKKFPKIQKDVPLAPFTAYKIGGKADYYYKVKSTDKICEIIKYADENGIPCFIIGGACNTVFSDKGFRGIVIHNSADNVTVKGSRIIAESGALLSKVISRARQHDLGGITALIGLPGTVGGAVYGNAGAHGVEIGDFVEKIKLFDSKKGVHEENREFFQFSYRYSILKKTKEIVLEIMLDLPPLDPEEIKTEVLKFRAEKQPRGKVAGSFFTNPGANESAGFLIDKAGLKGLKEGDIMVSQKHGNWLLNVGEGTQKQLVKLAKKIKNRIKDLYNINLEPENIVVDEYGNRIDI
jgi:UDP-N-acetylmuramate dehydrogenase